MASHTNDHIGHAVRSGKVSTGAVLTLDPFDLITVYIIVLIIQSEKMTIIGYYQYQHL